jgi:hypothetical protein
MRFSLLGLSGWQGAALGTPDSPFDIRGLAARLHIFKWIALASVAARTGPGFHLHLSTRKSLSASNWSVRLTAGIAYRALAQ